MVCAGVHRERSLSRYTKDDKVSWMKKGRGLHNIPSVVCHSSCEMRIAVYSDSLIWLSSSCLWGISVGYR